RGRRPDARLRVGARRRRRRCHRAVDVCRRRAGDQHRQRRCAADRRHRSDARDARRTRRSRAANHGPVPDRRHPALHGGRPPRPGAHRVPAEGRLGRWARRARGLVSRRSHRRSLHAGAGRARGARAPHRAHGGGERAMKTVLITGSSGLIGSEAVAFFDRRGWAVHGVDNNMRRDFFGPDGDTTWNLERLRQSTTRFTHHPLDIRDREAVAHLVRSIRPDLVIHAAAQPSHDLAKDRPFDDFDVNAGGTLNLLEAVRRGCPESPFIFMSTNKVYGDAPNELALVELATRYDYADPADWHGVAETCRVDACLHSLFGASKLAADVMVQEYGRYFQMPTVCFRGGCLTGPNHSGAELHGFLAYLARAVAEERRYRIYGYGGKQVRDNI